MRNLDNPKAVERLDSDMLKELKKMRKQGLTFARAGTLARKLSCDSVQALGSMERVKHKI